MTSTRTSISTSAGANPLVAIFDQAISSPTGTTPELLLDEMMDSDRGEVTKALRDCLNLNGGARESLSALLKTHDHRVELLQDPMILSALRVCLGGKRPAPSVPSVDGFEDATPSSKRQKPNDLPAATTSTLSGGTGENEDCDLGETGENEVSVVRTSKSSKGELRAGNKKAGKPKMSLTRQLEIEEADTIYTQALAGLSNNKPLISLIQKKAAYKEQFLSFATSTQMPSTATLQAKIPEWVRAPGYSTCGNSLSQSIRDKLTNADTRKNLELFEIIQIALVYCLATHDALRPESVPTLLKSVTKADVDQDD